MTVLVPLFSFTQANEHKGRGPGQPRKAPHERKTQTGIGFEPHTLRYIDGLRATRPEFRKLTRSALVNMIIEEYAEAKGEPLLDEATHG